MSTETNQYIDFNTISGLFKVAAEEKRMFLYEYEVYNLLASSGAETPPKSIFIPRNARPSENEMLALPGDKVVLKIVSPPSFTRQKWEE